MQKKNIILIIKKVITLLHIIICFLLDVLLILDVMVTINNKAISFSAKKNKENIIDNYIMWNVFLKTKTKNLPAEAR